jgi:hypothetical protein
MKLEQPLLIEVVSTERCNEIDGGEIRLILIYNSFATPASRFLGKKPYRPLCGFLVNIST